MDAPSARRILYRSLQFSILPYLFLNATLCNPSYWSGLSALKSLTPAEYRGWAEGLQGSAAALILFAFILVCIDRPRWGEWMLVVGALACGIVESVYLWIHRERDSIPYAGYPLWVVIVHLIITTMFGFSALAYLVLSLLNSDDEGLTGDRDIVLPETVLTPPPRDVIGGHRTILYRWAGYIAAVQATVTAVPLVGLAATSWPWSLVRTPAGVASVVISILLAFFIVTYGAFAYVLSCSFTNASVMRGPWSTATQDKFYLRAKIALLLSVAFTTCFAPLSFPRPHGYGDEVTPIKYFVWALGIAGAMAVLVMLVIIIRFERHRGVALMDDSDDATLAD